MKTEKILIFSRFIFIAGILCQFLVCGLVFSSEAAIRDLTLLSDKTSGQPVGTRIVWTASAAGIGSISYRFILTFPGETPRVIKDFSASPTLEWVPLTEGAYVVTAEAREDIRKDIVISASASFSVNSRVTGMNPVVTPDSANPLVALFSAPACAAGSFMKVEFWEAGSTDGRMKTRLRPCTGTTSMNFIVAGMKPACTYEFSSVTISMGIESRSDTVSLTTGTPDFTFPQVSVRQAPDSSTSTGDRFVWHSLIPASGEGLPPIPMATDLAGNPVWYYTYFRSAISISSTITQEGNTLIIAGDENKVQGQYLREVDLSGNLVRETNIARINELLAAMGKDPVGAFDHEAIRFPNGQTLVQTSLEKILPGVQPPVDNILGVMLIALDRDWQIAWTWNAFDHLDVNRKASNGEICVETQRSSTPGCPPLFKSTSANDWIHGNTIAYSPADGNLTFSMRNQDWIIKIRYGNGTGNGDILWKLGKDGDFSFDLNDLYPFSHQHGAAFMNSSEFVIFDNGNMRCAGDSSCSSRGQVYRLDESALFAFNILNHAVGNYSLALGMAQRLSNGNYAFTSGAQQTQPGDPFFGQSIEVLPTPLPQGKRNFVIEESASLYRSFRLAAMDSFSRTGSAFYDVPYNHWAVSFVNLLAETGISLGCGNGNYCPGDSVTRAQMAVFLERGLRGTSFLPPPATGIFADVPVSAWEAPWIETLYADGVTLGCSASPLLYCPGSFVTRAEMALFLLRTKYGSSYVPPPATGTMFSDVPSSHWAAAWIEQLARDGITAGCETAKYCPEASVSREQMAAFLVRTFLGS